MMAMERSGRRFTILDGLLLTIVMAAASLSDRSELALIGEQLRQVYADLRTTPNYLQYVFLGHPPDSQFKSVHKLMTWSVMNTLPNSGKILPFWLPNCGVGLFLVRQCALLGFPVLLGLSFALPLLRMVRPRPGWAEVARQPGCSACLAAVVALFLGFWAEELFRVRSSLAIAGWAVALVWARLALARSWRSEKSWVDRAGRVVGVCWLLAGGLAAT